MTASDDITTHVYVREDGPRGAPTLVLVHGSAASTRSWDALVPFLTDSHRVVRVDLLGHGRSAKPDHGDYGVPVQGRRVAEVLDRLCVERAVVVGHSSGGIVATALAEQRPDLVTALVLVNTGPSMDAFAAQEVPIEPAQWASLTDEQIREVMRPAFSRPGFQIPQPLVDDVRGMTYHAFTAALQASSDYLRQRSLPERLDAVGKPLLVLFGEEDRRWRSSSAADYRAVDGAVVELLPGIGHSPILEDPQRSAASLLPFATTHAAHAT